MLSVRLLTQGANGNVVADGMFDPPAGAVIRHDSVPQAHLESEAGDATAVQPSPLAAGAFMVPNDTGTTRREAVVDSVFLRALNRGFEAAVPLALRDSLFAQPALELSSPGTVSAVDDVHLSGTDSKAGTQDFPFGNNDNGVHVFSVPLNTLGFQTIKLTDTTDNSIFGNVIVDVLAQSGGGGGP
jgi:hypothetical protein